MGQYDFHVNRSLSRLGWTCSNQQHALPDRYVCLEDFGVGPYREAIRAHWKREPHTLTRISMLMKNFLLAFACAVTSLCQAQTTFSGGIYSNTTWTLAGSPYIITGTVVVFDNVTL